MAKSGSSYKISPLNGLQHSLADRADERPKTAWSRIYLCTLLTFSSSVQFTMFFTSMYPFLRTKDKTVSEGFFGVVITMYSVSQIIASPLLGIWSNQIGKLKPPLILCNLTMFVGNLIYFLIELFPPEHTRYLMLVSRFIVGIGWAQVGLLKSFASAASLPEDRTKATAYITGGVALGVILGPALQMVFTFIGDGVLLFEFSDRSFLKLSMFTMPALFTSIFNIFLILLLVFKFQETFVGFAGAPKQTDKKSEDGKETPGPTLPPYDKWAAGVCFAMRFTQYFIYTNLET
ncbi:hypothetical protein niasHT_035446 [Heterodera trifolii]|uniref:Major facilitator superfamily (MFS) profile domain-containing protein n=1 Tax=Heterodera trifolii TaxID=157864 RepID=A0ABD2I7J5_9BILA